MCLVCVCVNYIALSTRKGESKGVKERVCASFLSTYGRLVIFR